MTNEEVEHTMTEAIFGICLAFAALTAIGYVADQWASRASRYYPGRRVHYARR